MAVTYQRPAFCLFGAPGRIWTCGLRIRS